MKYQIPILAALFALMLSACSSDDASDIIPPSDASHEVSIMLTPQATDGQGTRATVEGDDKYNENLISYVNLYFFTGADAPADGSEIAYTLEHVIPATYSQQGIGEHKTTLQFRLSDSEISSIFGTGNSCRVFVLANYNNSLSPKTYSDLMNAQLTSSEFTDDDRVSGLVMTGEGQLTYSDGNITGSNIPMYRHAAKIRIRFANATSDTWQLDTVEAKIKNINSVTTFERTTIPTLSGTNVALSNSAWHGMLKMELTNPTSEKPTYDIMPIYSYPIDWLGNEESGPQVLAIARWKKAGTDEGESTATAEERVVSYQFPLIIQTGSAPNIQTINRLASNTSYIVNIPLTAPTE